VYWLIKIERNRWIADWLPVGVFPADGLLDLKTQDNKLSVWQVDPAKENLARVASALAANRQFLDTLDCVLLPQGSIEELGIEVEKTNGATPDAGANDLFHRDLIELSGQKVVDVGTRIAGAERKRFWKSEVRELLIAGLSAGELDRALMKADLVAKLGNSEPAPR
jgi:hypothetical protein